ncbi:hypothetical protein QZH41_020010, partial [Actinostola sp. cb2023]
KRGLLERLDAGEVVVGDGGFVFCMEKRGYVKAGPWTPEVTVEHPEAVRQLHREFLRAGADVMQTFTFYASDDKLRNRGHDAAVNVGCEAVNQAACDLAREVANEGDALVAGNICQLPSYLTGAGKEVCQAQFNRQLDVFIKNDVDFLIGELFEHVEEAEWAIEVMKGTGKPVVCCLTISASGDLNGVSVKECTVRIAKAGADVVGVNCFFDPDVCIETVRIMKAALDEAGIKKHLITQPIGYKTPECLHGNLKLGMTGLPEFPFALESRLLTRWDCHKYAREAYELGVRYIGACCGLEPYHVRAIAEELAEERGKLPAASSKHSLWGEALKQHTYPWVRPRSTRSYWENLEPTSGRPYASSMRKYDHVFDTQSGHSDMKQQTEMTSEEEIKNLTERVERKV